MSAVSERLLAFLCERLGLSEAQVSLESRLREDLDLDSMAMLELSMHLEEHFGKTIEQREIDKLQTVRDLAGLLTTKLS